MLQRPNEDLLLVGDADLFDYTAEPGVDGSRGNSELIGDLLGTHSVQTEPHDIALTRRKLDVFST
jgi:hypothetical protein